MLTVNNEQYRAVQLNFCHRYLDSLALYQVASLNSNNKIDYKIIENQLRYTLWKINTAKEYTWNPAIYNIASSFAYILNEPYDKLEKRLLNLYTKMQYVTAYYEAAKANIHQPVRELTELAILQNNGGLGVYSGRILLILSSHPL